MNMLIGVSVLAMFIFSVVIAVLLFKHILQNSREMQDLAYYRKTYLRIQGSSLKHRNYYLISLDGGKRWYAHREDGDGSVIILGTADEVFPGLLASHRGMEELVAYVEKHGPITLQGEETEAQLELLNRAGFEVKPMV